MSQAPSNPASDHELLPDTYDELVPVEQLVHGDHNPRRVRPSETLKQSIAGFGINDPLIVRPASDEDNLYHITDGWQRYQAAVSCGWEQLPVRIYEDTLDALEATEMDSIVRESTYEWAQYCRSLAAEIETNTESKAERARQVAARTCREADTVRKYIDVLSLPDEVHVLLSDGPDGTDQQWAALKNYNEDVRQYGDLQWRVADRLARNQSDLSDKRVIETAATAVEFQAVEQAIEFVDLAVANPETRIDVLHRKVLFGKDYEQYLVVPRTPVQLSTAEKRAIKDYCHEQRKPFSKIISENITSLADELLDSDENQTNMETDCTAESDG